jgi:hypothetical protein
METNLSFDVKKAFSFFLSREKAIDSFAGEMRMLKKNEEAWMDGWMERGRRQRRISPFSFRIEMEAAIFYE